MPARCHFVASKRKDFSSCLRKVADGIGVRKVGGWPVVVSS